MTVEPEARWSHCSNWLGSHHAQPGTDQWDDHTTRELVAVCNECGYCVWFTTRWQTWRT